MVETGRNRARCKRCGDVVESTYRHDIVWCSCGAIAVDGGTAYFRRVLAEGVRPDEWEEMP